jgi:hypothetical protein
MEPTGRANARPMTGSAIPINVTIGIDGYRFVIPILHRCGLQRATPFDAPGPLCEVHLRKGDVSIGLIGAVLALGTPQEVTLQELRVRCSCRRTKDRKHYL